MRALAITTLRRLRLLILVFVDSFAWLVAVYLATALRFETDVGRRALDMNGGGNRIPLYGVLVIAGIAIACHVLLAWTVRLHQGRTALGSFEEIFLLASVLIAAGVVATVVNVMVDMPFVPRSVPVIASFIALVFCAWPRALWRVLMNQARPHGRGTVSTPAIIVGAGEAGRQLVVSMQYDQELRWQPVGFLDDDPRLKHRRFRGVRMLGPTDDIDRAAARTGATTVIVAIPSADSSTISRINDLALDAGLDVKVLPNVSELLTGVHHTAIRDIEPEDLLGRNQVDTDIEAIAGYLSGKRVLVTGAGGSIGSELCRQIARLCPATLIMLDRDESALHALLLSIYGRADLESRNVVLANIRESDRVRQIFDDYRPEVVFHAAALKHVNMLEGHAAEAVKTNVLGTLHVLEAAAEFGVDRFVNISTDKAADPVNVLGYTKRLAEGLTASVGSAARGTYLSVRFGNVLGTSGSVLRTFAAQVKTGGPITITDPHVTRYFMTINEAVQLVIQAAAIGRDGEALVLDMGTPVKIADVAKQIIAQSRKPIEIVFTGLKPGEKLHEVLHGEGEEDVRPIHPLISHVTVPPVCPVDALDVRLDLENHSIVETVAMMTAMMTVKDRIHPASQS